MKTLDEIKWPPLGPDGAAMMDAVATRQYNAIASRLGARTVAVFPYEDRGSEHRLKADEAWPVGPPWAWTMRGGFSPSGASKSSFRGG